MTAIDHFFVFTRLDAPEQQRLIERGLKVGARREHAGQGTQNVCFSFANSYLELIWLADEQGAREPMVKPLGLYERMHWRDHRASPFGVCVKSEQPEPGQQQCEPPFAHWDYRPQYLPADASIRMGCNSGVIGEPLLFQLDRAGGSPESANEPHTLSGHRLHKLKVTTPALAPMSLLHDLKIEGLELVAGDEHLMEAELRAGPAESGSEATGQELDLRPELPLVLRW